MKEWTHPVVSCAEAGELEKKRLQGDLEREWEAMQRAGGQLAAALGEDFQEIGSLRERDRLLILAGKGHNAGDAFIAAETWLRRKPERTVRVCFVFGEDSLVPLARKAWRNMEGFGGQRVTHFSLAETKEVRSMLQERCGGRWAIFLDGLFGMNFRPPFRTPVDEVVRWSNEELEADLRAAVDLPSGVSDAKTDLSIRTDFTYMTGSAKAPLFASENAEAAGRIRYLDLGFFAGKQEENADRRVLLPQVIRPLVGLRPAMAHKKTFGHLLFVGGSRRMPGAALMSILAAARSGVGLLTAAVPESLVPEFATVVPEAMWIGCPETEEGGLALESFSLIRPFMEKATALAMGPGVGTERETQVLLEEIAREAKCSLMIDAEALQPAVVQQVARREEMRGRVVLTPHPGEYRRITGTKFDEEGEAGLRRFCRKSGVVTLLKGPPFTRICDGETIVYSLLGGPVLGRGGSGDVLSGILGGQLAQKPEEAFASASRAAYWHGAAAELLAREKGQVAVRTTEVLDYLSAALRQ